MVSSTTATTTLDEVKSARTLNWKGSIPVLVSLAPDCRSTPAPPPVTVALVARQSYLSLQLRDVVNRLSTYGPPVMLHQTSKVVTEPVDDDNDETQKGADDDDPPHRQQEQDENTTAEKQPLQNNYWWTDEETGDKLRSQWPVGVVYDALGHGRLPWKLRLHIGTTTTTTTADHQDASQRRLFQHAVKQAVTLRATSSAAALQLLTKERHEQLWQSVASSHCATFDRVWDAVVGAAEPSESSRVPVRLWYQGRVHQRSCSLSWTVQELLSNWINLQVPSPESNDISNDWSVVVQGVTLPSWKISVDTLWRHLAHPDLFVYLVLVPQKPQ